MIKRILAGLAETPFTSVAIRRAVELGRLHEAEVLGVTVVDRPSRLPKTAPRTYSGI